MLALNTVVDGGRFHVLDILGKGGSGVAYLAFDLQNSTPNKGKYYAIKCLLRSSDQSALLREVQLHKSVSKHENIVSLRRCVPEGQFQILIMDYCPDGDLFRLITQKRGCLLPRCLGVDPYSHRPIYQIDTLATTAL